MQERDNLIDILEKTKKAVKEEDIVLIKELSNRTIHSASIYSDPDNVTTAVVIYAISKMVERKKYHGYKEWPSFFQTVMNGLSIAIIALKQKDEVKFRKALTEIRKRIMSASGSLHRYIEEVFRKAQINKASRVYEHGVSMEQTAQLLGITVFELAEYAGRTGISDVDLSITKPIKERIRIAEEIFR